MYSNDILSAKAALIAIDALEDEFSTRIPTLITVDLEPGGTILSGQPLDML